MRLPAAALEDALISGMSVLARPKPSSFLSASPLTAPQGPTVVGCPFFLLLFDFRPVSVLFAVYTLTSGNIPQTAQVM